MINSFKKSSSAIALIILFVTVSAVAQTQNIATKIDSLLENVFKGKDGPGGIFMVAKQGKPIYQKAFGKANLELNVDLKTEDVFQLGSMTKQFTAVAILQLEEQGKLNVNDLIFKFIPDYPNGNKITLHHLLTHTSGIKDFTKMKSLQQIAQKDLSPTEMIAFFKNEPVDFPPGEKFDYNNSGYFLLGYVIEIVSGEKYEDYIKKYIFDKAEMTNSRYANDIAVIANRAYGYHKKENGYVNKSRISFNIPHSSGALMSTLGDMLKWQNALNKNLLVNANAIKRAFNKYKLNSGEEFTYGYGWHIKDINGTEAREHGGSIFGFKTMGVYIPSKDIYVLGFSNCDCNSPTQVTRDIAELVLKSKF
jgi:CubicO group peptidase (beta-lactamase class C family)